MAALGVLEGKIGAQLHVRIVLHDVNVKVRLNEPRMMSMAWLCDM